MTLIQRLQNPHHFTDYIPFVSSATNIYKIFNKATEKSHDTPPPLKDHKITFLDNYGRNLLLLVPILGNFIIGLVDFIAYLNPPPKNETKKPVTCDSYPIMLETLKLNPSATAIEMIGDELKGNADFFLKALEIPNIDKTKLLMVANEKIFTDPNIQKQAYDNKVNLIEIYHARKFIDYLNNENMVTTSLNLPLSGSSFAHLSNRLKSDRLFCLNCIAVNPTVFPHIAEYLKAVPDFLEDARERNEDITGYPPFNDSNKAMKLYTENNNALDHYPELKEMIIRQAERTTLMRALTLPNVDGKIPDVDTKKELLMKANTEIFSDPQFQAFARAQKLNLLEIFHARNLTNLLNDQNLVLSFLSIKGDNFKYLDDKLKANEPFCLRAIELNEDVFPHISDALKNNETFQLDAFRKNNLIVKYPPLNDDAFFFDKAITSSDTAMLLKFASYRIKNNYDICSKAYSFNNSILDLLDKQSEAYKKLMSTIEDRQQKEKAGLQEELENPPNFK